MTAVLFLYLKHSIKENEFYPRVQAKRTQLGPTNKHMRRFKVCKMLILVGGLCCVGFINPVGVVAGVRRYRIVSYIGHY
jgi:hypothetical protein